MPVLYEVLLVDRVPCGEASGMRFAKPPMAVPGSPSWPCAFGRLRYVRQPSPRRTRAPSGGGAMTTVLMWLQIATGFTGALTLVFLVRLAARHLGRMASTAVYFSPKGGCQEAVVGELRAARREILVQAYSFTSDALSRALLDAKKRCDHVEELLYR